MAFTASIFTKYKANICRHFSADIYPNWTNDVENMATSHLRPLLKYDSQCAEIHETHKMPKGICRGYLL
jgi:hypothetical protein